MLIIEVSSEAALAQIRNKNYAKDQASRYPNVLLVAINYDKENKEHQCSVEKYAYGLRLRGQLVIRNLVPTI